MIRILIEIEGGVLNSVSCDAPDGVSILVIDDDGKEGGYSTTWVGGYEFATPAKMGQKVLDAAIEYLEDYAEGADDFDFDNCDAAICLAHEWIGS
jgi:hypothetical protein